MKGRKWVRIDVAEYERLMKAEAEAQEKIRMANKLRDLWMGEAQSAQLERNDAEDYIKRLEDYIKRLEDYICMHCCRKCKRRYRAEPGEGCTALDEMKAEKNDGDGGGKQ